MTSQQLRHLLRGPNVQLANEHALGMIESRFKCYQDLQHIEDLVSEAARRQDELKATLGVSEPEILSFIATTRVAVQTHAATAQDLALLRHSLTDELANLVQVLLSSTSSEDKPPTLLEDVETLHRNLQELQSVKVYVQVIERALKLSESAVTQVRTTNVVSSSSVTEYKALQSFVKETAALCALEQSGSEQSLHLVTLLKGIEEKTWLDMKGILSSSLLDAAEKIGWPMPVDYAAATPQHRNAFEAAFQNLLRLQIAGDKIRQGNPTPRTEKDGLYPLQSLVIPISLRFKYHFEGSRQTNRLDKPEWYFTHVSNTIHEHRPFMELVGQTLLSSTEFHGMNAWREFTLLLLPLLARKLRHSIPSLLPHPSLLAHTIYQAVTFDAALIEQGFHLEGTSAAKLDSTETKWEGISHVILGNKEWFEAWVAGEQKFTEDQYHEIISDSDAWLISDDVEEEDSLVGRGLKSTKSARRLKALVEQVTDRYSPLPHFRQRTRFLVGVQVPLLEYYQGRIASSLDAYETLSSAFVRAVPGALGVTLRPQADVHVKIDPRKLTDGVEGVQRLCKAWLSAKYVQSAMEAWGEETFFLELWSEINQKVSSRTLPEEDNGTISATAEVPQDTIFEELIDQYQKLTTRAEEMIVHQVCGEIESELKTHFNTPNNSPTDDIAISQTLLAPVALLSSHLQFLCHTLPQATFTVLYRQVANRLSEHIYQRQILFRGPINAQQCRTIHGECELLVETCYAALASELIGGRKRIESPWIKLIQAGRLLGLEGGRRQELADITFGPETDEEWQNAMIEATNASEIAREEVGRILRSINSVVEP